MQIKKLGWGMVTALALGVGSMGAQAAMVSYPGFTRITSDASTNIAGQFSMTLYTEGMDPYGPLTNVDGSDVLLTFNNAVGTASEVAEIYFDDGGGLLDFGTTTIINSLGGTNTSFQSTMVAPPNLPAGNSIPSSFGGPFAKPPSFAADSDVQGQPPNDGLDETTDIVGFLVEFSPGQDLDALVAAILDSTFRVGIHVRSIDGGPSDSFINGPEDGVTPPSQVPIPAAIWMFGAAILGLVGVARTKGSRSAAAA